MLVKYESEMIVKATEVGREKQFRPRPVAAAAMPARHFIYDDWLFIPREEDNTFIPREAERRIEALQNAGIPIVGQVVAHEAPKLLPAPTAPIVDWDKVKKGVSKGAVKTLSLTTAFTVAVAKVMGYAVLIGLGSLVMLDPALIAVVEDPETGEHYWLEVARWKE